MARTADTTGHPTSSPGCMPLWNGGGPKLDHRFLTSGKTTSGTVLNVQKLNQRYSFTTSGETTSATALNFQKLNQHYGFSTTSGETTSATVLKFQKLNQHYSFSTSRETTGYNFEASPGFLIS